MKPKVVCATIAAVLFSLASSASAQDLNTGWFTIDGGGRTSAGRSYALSGTAGQPDAGTMTGGGFTFQGGFWSATLPTASLRLSVTTRADGVVLSWPASVNAVVQTATTLTSPDPIWQSFPGDPIEVSNRFELIIGPVYPADPMRFFRLVSH